MQRTFSRLVPPVLKNIDRWLLLHKPGLWSTRVHYVLFYAGLGLAGIFLYQLFRPISVSDVPDPTAGTIVLTALSAIAFLFWAWWTKAFVVEDHLGMAGRGNALRDQLLYGLILGLLVALPFSYAWLTFERIANKVDPQTLSQDIDYYNAGAFFYEVSPAQARLSFETLQTQKGLSKPLNISYGAVEVNSTYQAYRMFQNAVARGEEGQLLREHLRVAQKYSPRGSFTPADPELLAQKWREGRFHRNHAFGDPYEMRWNIQKLVNAPKNQHELTDDVGLQVLGLGLGFLFLATLLFFQIGWKLFLGALATFLGLTAVTSMTISIISAVFHYNDAISITGVTISALFILSIWISARWKGSQRGKIVQQIALSQAAFFTPFIPLLLRSWMYIDPSESEARLLLWMGIGLAVLAWNLFYRPRFVQIVARPQDS